MTVYASISKDQTIIDEAVASDDFRRIGRVVRQLPSIRKRLTIDQIKPGLVGEVCFTAREILGFPPVLEESSPKSRSNGHSIEAQLWAALLAGVVLLDGKKFSDSEKVFTTALEFLTGKHRPAADHLNAKLVFFLAVAVEHQGRLPELYNKFLALYRTACLHNNLSTQAVLLNSLLRILVNGRQFEQCVKLVEKTNFPETRSNADYARYLFYVGRIKSVRLEYSEAFAKLSQACKKAPKGRASFGFRTIATKFAVIAELLTGDIPDRSLFNDPELSSALKPYFVVTQAVRTGDVSLFEQAMEKFHAQFEKDETLSLVKRLHHNVLKAGLRALNAAYSKISLEDVARKLSLPSAEVAAGLAAKAIADGVIDGRIEGSVLVSSWIGDLYSTEEPQAQLHKRIAFCLQLHEDSLKAMQFPDKKLKLDNIDDQRRREEEELDLEGDLMDDDMSL